MSKKVLLALGFFSVFSCVQAKPIALLIAQDCSGSFSQTSEAQKLLNQTLNFVTRRLASNLDILVLQRFGATTETIFEETVPMNINGVIQEASPQMGITCKNKGSGFNQVIQFLNQMSSDYPSYNVFAVLITDGAYKDDPQLGQLKTNIQQLKTKTNITYVQLLGVKTEQRDSIKKLFSTLNKSYGIAGTIDAVIATKSLLKKMHR